MRNAKWLLVACLVAVTAGCVQNGYPNTAYRGNNDARYWNSPTRDYDRDGIPNRYDRDADGDRAPDRYQGR